MQVLPAPIHLWNRFDSQQVVQKRFKQTKKIQQKKEAGSASEMNENKEKKLTTSIHKQKPKLHQACTVKKKTCEVHEAFDLCRNEFFLQLCYILLDLGLHTQVSVAK